MTLSDLIAELERATEGSRELDLAICRGIGAAVIASPRRPVVKFARGDHWRSPPAYTTSLDAALSLVPEGWSWMVRNVHGNMGGPQGVAYCTRPDTDNETARAATPALALVIAALKARMSDSQATKEA